MRVAIVGSRHYKDLLAVRAYVRLLPIEDVVVTGGAPGVDTTAEQAARRRGMIVDVYLPDYEKHGKRAPLVRNETIAATCDRMVAFHDNWSRGTLHAIGWARRLGKHVDVIRIDDPKVSSR